MGRPRDLGEQVPGHMRPHGPAGHGSASETHRLSACTDAPVEHDMQALPIAAIIAVAAVALASCVKVGGGREPVESTTEITSARFGFIPRDEVIERLTAERCQHEDNCHNVGPDGTFVNTEACMRVLGGTERQRLQSSSCVRGSTQSDLQACIESIRNERCQNAEDTALRLQHCNDESLCR